MGSSDGIPPELLNQPTTMVNRFRIAEPAKYGDHYIYVPGTFFRWPGEGAIANLDIDPNNYGKPTTIPGQATYVLDGPAFLAWPVNQPSFGDAVLVEYRSKKPVDGGIRTTGRRLLPASEPSHATYPDFAGFNVSTTIPGQMSRAVNIYEHEVLLDDGMTKYMYDAIPDPHDGWGGGTPRFYAVPTGTLAQQLIDAAKARQVQIDKDLASANTQTALANANQLLAPGKTVDETNLDNLLAFFTGKGLPVKAFTTGISVDAGLIVSGAYEHGTVWDLKRDPIQDYTTLSGGLASSAGATLNATLGFWWGDSEEAVLKNMEGIGWYTFLGATSYLGLNIITTYTSDGLAFGLTLSVQTGLEFEVGGGVGGSYTSFYSPATGGVMRMPTE